MSNEVSIKRAHSYQDIERFKFKTLKVADSWKEHLGTPQQGACSILIYGFSGNGKSSYALQISKMLCQQGQAVLYNSLEEGMKLSFKRALERNNMKGVSNFRFVSEEFEAFEQRLIKKRQAKIVVIDSVRIFFRKKSKQQIAEFMSRYKDTTFICIAGAEGKQPEGVAAKEIYYLSDVVINIKDFEAVCKKNRMGGQLDSSYIIWHEGYNQRNTVLLQKG